MTVLDTADLEFQQAIHEAIKAYNNNISPAHRDIRANGGRPLHIAVHDGSGDLVGGLTAHTYWGWLDIDDLWLREDYRRLGHGSILLAAA